MDPRLADILKRRLTKPTDDPVGDTVSLSIGPQSDTALVVDKWGKRRGDELASDEYDASLMSDCHTAMFEPAPVLADNPADKQRSKWFRDLLESEDYASLHATTELDDTLSELAAKRIAEKYVAWRSKHDDERDDKRDDKRVNSDDVDRMRSVHEALESASEDCDEVKSVYYGMGEGVNSIDSVKLDRIMDSYDKIASNGSLRRIFDIAGRLRRFARAAQQSKTKHGYDDMVGVHLDGNPAHLVSAELSKLDIEGLDLDLLRRIATRQAVCRQYEGVQPEGQGPVVVVVDESGSMRGSKVDSAKGLALTMGWVAMHQKRWITFIGYSGGYTGNLLTFKPGRWDQEKLLEWLVHFYDNGSDLDLPIYELPNVYWPKLQAPKGKTDVVFITDAECNINSKMRSSFLAWKAAEKVHCYGITIGRNVGQLELICDQTWSIPNIDLSEDAIKQVLSI